MVFVTARLLTSDGCHWLKLADGWVAEEVVGGIHGGGRGGVEIVMQLMSRRLNVNREGGEVGWQRGGGVRSGMWRKEHRHIESEMRVKEDNVVTVVEEEVKAAQSVKGVEEVEDVVRKIQERMKRIERQIDNLSREMRLCQSDLCQLVEGMLF